MKQNSPKGWSFSPAERLLAIGAVLITLSVLLITIAKMILLGS